MEELVQNGTYKDFKVHLVRLNALFRNISSEEHEIDGETAFGDSVLLGGFVPISPRLTH